MDRRALVKQLDLERDLVARLDSPRSAAAGCYRSDWLSGGRAAACCPTADYRRRAARDDADLRHELGIADHDATSVGKAGAVVRGHRAAALLPWHRHREGGSTPKLEDELVLVIGSGVLMLAILLVFAAGRFTP